MKRRGGTRVLGEEGGDGVAVEELLRAAGHGPHEVGLERRHQGVDQLGQTRGAGVLDGDEDAPSAGRGLWSRLVEVVCSDVADRVL